MIVNGVELCRSYEQGDKREVEYQEVDKKDSERSKQNKDSKIKKMRKGRLYCLMLYMYVFL